MLNEWLTVDGVILAGHGVASGIAKDSPYPAGTIGMQTPFFAALGLDLSACHPATVNISIAPLTFAMKDPQHTFRQVEWTDKHPPEDFSFSRCYVIMNNKKYPGWVYYPHPETKERHFQDASIIEVILEDFVDGLKYDSAVKIELNRDEVAVND